MSHLVVYAKKTCITCKKAQAYLDESGTDYELHDIVSEPPAADLLEKALDEHNLKAAMNSRSTLYKEKNLGKANITKAELIKLMLKDPNLIKRPFIVKSNTKDVYLGFDPDTLGQFIRR